MEKLIENLYEGRNLKIFKNKFFIIALSTALFLTVLTSTLFIMGKGDIFRNIANVVATPFRYIGVKVSESVDGFSRYFKNIDKLYEENQRLKGEINSLESEIAELVGADEENEKLREYLNVIKTYPSLELLDAFIIGESGDNHVTFFTLNRGSGDGVKLGMPIINEIGLVGSVCEVGYNWCRVRALTEASSGVGAYVRRSGEVGVISGIVPNKDGKTCVLEYLSENADIEVGDIVYTSGNGSSCPRDICIGKVVEVNIDKYLRTKTATVECAVDLDELKYVMIVTDYEIIKESNTDR